MMSTFKKNIQICFEKKYNNKTWFVKKNQICFYVKEIMRFLLKSIRSILCRVKKKR